MQELQMQEMDVLANIDDVSAEIFPHRLIRDLEEPIEISAPAKRRISKASIWYSDGEEMEPAYELDELKEFHLSNIDIESGTDKSIKQDHLEKWFDWIADDNF